MKNYQLVQLRAFPVRLLDERTKETREDTIVFSKSQLQAAQITGQSSRELICKAYKREGFTVLQIGKAAKQEVVLDLEKLYFEEVEN